VPSNPFSTRFIRPGAIEFLFPAGQSTETLVASLREHGWQGQIIGPHGSGKSTLIAALVPALEAAGRKVRVQGPGVRSQEPEELTAAALDAETQVIIDGFEQLGWWSRRKLKLICHSRGAGLLVTTHKDLGLPTLYRMEPSLELTRAVVARLLALEDETITADDIAQAFAATGGNLRETLFALYDVYQQRRPGY
jgi:ABC-type thiamine transport system ATPase subunit